MTGNGERGPGQAQETINTLMRAALAELDWNPPGPGAAIRLAERIEQLGRLLHAAAVDWQTGLETETAALQAFKKARIDRPHQQPTIATIRRNRR